MGLERSIPYLLAFKLVTGGLLGGCATTPNKVVRMDDAMQILGTMNPKNVVFLPEGYKSLPHTARVLREAACLRAGTWKKEGTRCTYNDAQHRDELEDVLEEVDNGDLIITPREARPLEEELRKAGEEALAAPTGPIEAGRTIEVAQKQDEKERAETDKKAPPFPAKAKKILGTKGEVTYIRGYATTPSIANMLRRFAGKYKGTIEALTKNVEIGNYSEAKDPDALDLVLEAADTKKDRVITFKEYLVLAKNFERTMRQYVAEVTTQEAKRTTKLSNGYVEMAGYQVPTELAGKVKALVGIYQGTVKFKRTPQGIVAQGEVDLSDNNALVRVLSEMDTLPDKQITPNETKDYARKKLRR
ncbi:hypothetical protein KY339_03260 [Candidatus Woesearchaeota archaeon]|nr:hypothetical protein [Candidatus Woesearchaeota archaeon]